MVMELPRIRVTVSVRWRGERWTVFEFLLTGGSLEDADPGDGAAVMPASGLTGRFDDGERGSNRERFGS
jgi:hypothetical protein